MRLPDGTLDAIRISLVSHHRDMVADVRLGHPRFEALDVANVNTPHHGTGTTSIVVATSYAPKTLFST